MSDKRILCLDWDSRFVRFVLARCSKREVTIRRALSERIPADVEGQGAVALGEFIRDVLDREKIRVSRCVVDIPRDQAVLNTLILPAAGTDELASMVEFQISKELPFSVDEAALDFVTAHADDTMSDPGAPGDIEQGGTDAQKMAEQKMAELHIAAVRNEVLEYYQQVCKAAGLELVRIGLRPHANLIALNHLLDGRGRGRTLFVDIGPSLTEIDVLRDGRLVFSRAASVAVPEVDARGRAVEATSGERQAEAEKVHLLEPAPDVDSVVSELLVEINRSIEAYRATDPGASLSRIIVGGSSGLEADLIDAIRERFDAPTKLYDPTRNLDIRARDVPPLQGMAAVLGLGISHAQPAAMTFDFLHPKKPGAERRARQKKIPVVAVTVLVFILAGGVAWWQTSGKHVSRQKAELDRQISQAGSFASNLLKQQKEFDHVRKWRSVQTQWADELKVLVDQLPGHKEAYVTRLTMNNKGEIGIKLQAKSNDAATKLAEKLAAIKNEKKVGKTVTEVPAYSAKVGRTAMQEPPNARAYKWSSPLAVEHLGIKKNFDTATRKKKKSRAKGGK